MTARKTKLTAAIATAAEVRNMHKAAGNIVRISRDGHVKFKRDGEGPWLEGRWVSEHITDETGTRLR